MLLCHAVGLLSVIAALVLHTLCRCPGGMGGLFAVKIVLVIIASNVCKTIKSEVYV